MSEREEASRLLAGWLAAANAAALLRAACNADVLHRLAEPRTAGELAEQLGLEPARVTVFCQALEAHGIVVRDGDRYRTTPGFIALEGDEQPMLLSEQVAANEALQRGIVSYLEEAPGFSNVGADESLAFARLAWGRPGSAAAQAMWREVDRRMPEVVEVWEKGGTYAEFGCGAGRDLLRVAAMYPRVRVFGHDMLPHLIEECRANAESLGLADRVSLVLGDIASLELDSVYDTLMWSQMFFPPETRAAALATIRRALVPGGLLLMPLMPEVPRPEQTDGSPATRGLLLARLAYQRWQIQWQSTGTVRQEVEQAGFSYLRTIDNPRTPYLLARAR